MKKKISILGSTGSIGVNSLEVIKTAPETFEVAALAAGYNTHLLLEQIQKFHPRLVSVATETLAEDIREQFPSIEVLWGEKGLKEVATYSESNFVISALVGAKGIEPTLAAISSQKEVALANKEVLVAAGELVMEEVQRQHVQLLPIDSEHSGLWQCLQGRDAKTVRKLILTASGGPFFGKKVDFRKVTKQKALEHPKWKMGPKITIDSATMMNKGLEVIEAAHLFGVSPDRIEVLIHPEAMIHAMIEFVDGAQLAQLGIPDMRLPIQYAMSYPERLQNLLPSLDLANTGPFHFYKPDLKKFPCLRLGYEAIRKGGTMPIVLNAANEVAVQWFLNERISFDVIPKIIEGVMAKHRCVAHSSLDEILCIDHWAREKAEALC